MIFFQATITIAEPVGGSKERVITIAGIFIYPIKILHLYFYQNHMIFYDSELIFAHYLISLVLQKDACCFLAMSWGNIFIFLLKIH